MRSVGRKRAAVLAEFEILHKRRFGFVAENKALVIDAVEVETVGGGAAQMEREGGAVTEGTPAIARRTRFYSQGQFHDAPVLLRAEIAPGQRLYGPAIIIEPNQTIVVSFKDLGLKPSDVANFFLITTVPWMLKPLYGLVSDFAPLYGRRRKS